MDIGRYLNYPVGDDFEGFEFQERHILGHLCLFACCDLLDLHRTLLHLDIHQNSQNKNRASLSKHHSNSEG